MDVEFDLEGESFRWDATKAESNFAKRGVTFEQAAWAFLDPWFAITEAADNGENRQALIAKDRLHRVLYVVHIEFDRSHIRLISARQATAHERKQYGDF